MGIVKISEELHEAAKQMAIAMNRSINSQAEHWMRIGQVIEGNPNITYQEVRQKFLEAASQRAGREYVHENT